MKHLNSSSRALTAFVASSAVASVAASNIVDTYSSLKHQAADYEDSDASLSALVALFAAASPLHSQLIVAAVSVTEIASAICPGSVESCHQTPRQQYSMWLDYTNYSDDDFDCLTSFVVWH